VRELRLLIVDAAPVRFAVRMAFADDPVTCFDAADVQQAMVILREEPVDVCLVGQSLAGLGIDAVARLAEAVPAVGVLLISGSDRPEDLLAAVRAGAVGYVPASADAAQLRRVVKAVAANEAAVPRSMVIDLLTELRTMGRADDEGLTVREAEILRMLRRGQSTRSIASHLAISPVTVRRHISKLVQKTGVTDRVELVAATDTAH
jgi:DNA-binding NarL/FixJ family response regulator